MGVFTKDSKMAFGKHKGKAVKDVPASYLLWLDDNVAFKSKTFHKDLFNYIEENRPALKGEVRREKINNRYNSK